MTLSDPETIEVNLRRASRGTELDLIGAYFVPAVPSSLLQEPDNIKTVKCSTREGLRKVRKVDGEAKVYSN